MTCSLAGAYKVFGTPYYFHIQGEMAISETSVTILKDRQFKYKHNIETRSCKHCYSGKAVSITYSYCECSLSYPSMQCACAILSFVACSAIRSTLPHKRKVFREKKKVTEHKMCFDFLYNFSLKHYSFYEEMGDIQG
jgi:hypothetical protein